MATFEETFGLYALFPTSPRGLATACLFWVAGFYLCRFVSATVVPQTYSKLSVVERASWDNYAWSALHGVLGFSGAVRGVWSRFPGIPESHHESVPLYELYLLLTCSFAMLDLIQLIRHWDSKGSWMMLVHHIILPTAYIVALFVLPFGQYVMLILQLCEVTTPFLHLRYFLSTSGHKSSGWYVLNGIVFSALFFAVRGVLMTVMYYRIFSVLPNPVYWEGCAACTFIMVSAYAFQTLQYIWTVKVVTGLMAFMKGKDNPAKRD